MRLLMIRHGDPDYIHDSLTPRGRQEAEALGRYLPRFGVTDAYVSPLGRAKYTAEIALSGTGIVPEVRPWLEEFPLRIERPDCAGGLTCCWDWLPQDMAEHPELYLPEWKTSPALSRWPVAEKYDEVTAALDGVLADHGYVREGMLYRAERPNHEVLAFFCHFGIACVLISHLLHASPYVFWQGMAGAPTSVTSLFTEERRKGIAGFRMNEFGSTTHLAIAGLEPSRRCRYVECAGDDETGFESSYRVPIVKHRQ